MESNKNVKMRSRKTTETDEGNVRRFQKYKISIQYLWSYTMNISGKIKLFQSINSENILREELFFNVLEKCGDLKTNHVDYMTTYPINCDVELLRLPTADYDLCCALKTISIMVFLK